MTKTTIFRKDIIGWSLYDFANTIYSMNIVSLYLKRYIVEDLGKDDRYFDIPFSISMLLAAILLPALGSMSDHSTKKKLFVILFTLTCCVAVGLMAVVPASLLFMLLTLFIIANFSYEAAQPFYNSLLYSVAYGKQARFVSGFGVSLGYVGSIVGMILVLPFVTGALFSIDIPFISEGGKAASFIPTAVLFFLFTLPLILWVRERPVRKVEKASIAHSYKEVWEGITATKKYPGVLRFLISDYFFEDAVMTVILNIGIYCSIVLQLEDSQISLFLIISTITAVIGSLVIGQLARHLSLKKLLGYIVYGWILSLILFVLTDNMVIIWLLGSLVGVLLGGLWTITRPFLAELVPADELGKFFGLFALSGRAAAIIGPLVWTATVYFFNPNRPLGNWLVQVLNLNEQAATTLPYKTGVLSLVLMMIIGLIIYRKLPDPGSLNDE